MFTPHNLHEQMKTMDESQRSTFLKEHASELAEMLRRIGEPGSPDSIDAHAVELAREVEWCSQNPDPHIDVGTLLWTARRDERVPVTVTATQRFPDGRRRYTILKDGVALDWPEWLLMRRCRPT